MSDSIWKDPRITAYVLDELPDNERKEFEAELAGNAELEAAVAEARSVTGQLKGLFAAESTPSLDDERRNTIVTPIPSTSRSWKTPMIALATAASLLLLVGGPMWFNRQQAMVVGQVENERMQRAKEEMLAIAGEQTGVATDEELAEYADDLAKETQLEGMRSSSARGRQSEFTSNATVGRARKKMSGKDSLAKSGAAPQTEEAIDLDFSSEAILSESSRGQDLNQSSLQSLRAADTRPKGMSALGPISQKSERKRLARADEFGFAVEADKDDAVVALSDGSGRVAGVRYGESKTEGAVSVKLPAVRLKSQLSSGQPSNAIGRPVVPDEAKSFFGEDHLGVGPGNSGDKFQPITDNPFKRVAEHAMSTFSVDVDTASYSKTRDFLTRANQLPRPDAVRIEELVNYFNYDYKPPTADDEHPFTTHTVVTSCPWNAEHRLARIALKGKVMDKKERPRCNLVFLLDTSGSMNQPNKLPLVVEGMQMLLKQLDKKDRVAITVYAGSAGLVLDSTRAKKKKKIRSALSQLNAGGSTNGGAGIALAYQTARDNFIEDGVNRVILCTDGDFNVGLTGTDSLVKMVETEAKSGIFLSVLGFGMGNHNDAMLEQISGRGNGNYAFIDNAKEARKVLVDQTSATLVTIAKDVKLQIEFNPKQVSSYRLIGYENRVLAKEDFNDDKKDAGEIGAGHAVTALYEIVPAGVEADESRPAVDALKYQSEPTATDAADSDEMMTLKLRYKASDGDTSTLIEFPVRDEGTAFDEADKDVRFAAAVAGFGMQLRRSDYKGTWTLSDVQSVADKSKGEDENGLRTEFIELVRKASELMGQE